MWQALADGNFSYIITFALGDFFNSIAEAGQSLLMNISAFEVCKNSWISKDIVAIQKAVLRKFITWPRTKLTKLSGILFVELKNALVRRIAHAIIQIKVNKNAIPPAIATTYVQLFLTREFLGSSVLGVEFFTEIQI